MSGRLNRFYMRRMRGQSTVEYLVVLLFGVLVLVTGENPPIQRLASAIKEYYTDYSYAISVSSMPNCFKKEEAEIAGITATVTVDQCVDLKEPKWPIEISLD